MSFADRPPDMLAPELQAGEQVIWHGRPSPVATMLSHAPVALFGLLWLGFSAGAFVEASRSGAGLERNFVLLFAGAGVFMIAYPLLEYRKALRTLFAITDRRFLMITTGPRAIRSVDRRAIRQVERIERWGRVTLRIPTAMVSDGEQPKVDYTDLHGIPDADRAFRLLTEPPR